jgi:hypothetical protein
MRDQITGYYIEHKDSLLKEFDHIISLMGSSLVNRYRTEFADKLKAEIRQEYEKLIPEIPYIPGVRGWPLNFFLICTAQELGVYKAMKKHGKPVEEIWEVCHEALRLITVKIPKWKRWLLKHFMFSPMLMAIVERRANKQEKACLGDFEIEYLIGKGDDFDFGVNYLQCGYLNFVKNHDGEEFAPYVCMSDIALSDALGWGLIRTQTLADGCHHCDFRFKKGAKTQISSKTPEVQETIARIGKKEV